MIELRYDMGTRTPQQLNADISDFWATADSDPDLRRAIEDQGLALGDVRREYRPSLVTVGNRGMGFEPGAVELVIALAPAANVVMIDVWKRVLLPWILRARGDDAIGQARAESQDRESANGSDGDSNGQ